MTFTFTTPQLLWLLPLALIPFIPRRRRKSRNKVGRTDSPALRKA